MRFSYYHPWRVTACAVSAQLTLQGTNLGLKHKDLYLPLRMKEILVHFHWLLKITDKQITARQKALSAHQPTMFFIQPNTNSGNN